MDDGYRMLNHTVRQVLGNMPQAVKITLIPLILPWALMTVLLTRSDVTLVGDIYQLEEGSSGLFIAIAAIFFFLLIGFAWAAVAWHRFILVEEYPAGIAPSFSWERVGPYIGRSIIIGIVILVASLVVGAIAGIVIQAMRSPTIGFLVNSGLTLGASWLSARLGLILPAAALGRPMSLSESWEATKPISGDLLVPVFVLTLAVTIMTLLVPVVFGYGTAALSAGAVMVWFQILFNLSLMTTLYGTQIERRPLI